MAAARTASYELEQFSFSRPPIRASSSIADFGNQPTNLQAELENNTFTRDHHLNSDSVVSTSSKKLESLIDALLATTLALRQTLPGISIKDDLEEGKGIVEPPPGPRRSSAGGVGNRIYGAEDLPTILDTPREEGFVLAEEGKREIQAFVQAHPQSRLDDPRGPDQWKQLSLHTLFNESKISDGLSISPRKALQAKVLQALFGIRGLSHTFSEWALEEVSWDLDIGPFLVLLGQNYAGQVAPNQHPTAGDEASENMFEILAAICQATYDTLTGDERMNWSRLTFGACLKECYRQGLLHPNEGDIQIHAGYILKAIRLVSIDFTGPISVSSYLAAYPSLEEITKTRLSTIFCKGRPDSYRYMKSYSNSGSSPRDDTLELRDINIRILTSIGRIKIVWTSRLHEHLQLELGQGYNHLKVYWFAKTIETIPIFGLYDCGCSDHPSFEDMIEELRLTYQFLFGSFDDIQAARTIKKLYGQQEAPPWITGFRPTKTMHNRHHRARGWFRWRRTLASYIDVNNVDLYTDIGSHLCHTHIHASSADGHHPRLTQAASYKQFPTYEPKIRILKSYMAQQRAGTLRDLWRDRRDTLSWYTFWAVLIVGGAGLILTLASLGVSTAQTVAAFKALNPPANQAADSVAGTT